MSKLSIKAFSYLKGPIRNYRKWFQVSGHLRFVFPEKFEENIDELKSKVPTHFRHVYPEFIPDPNLKYRNPLREKLEREDMVKRRNVIDIPEFYVGSILAVTVSDPSGTNKSNRFLGICIYRGGHGLRSNFILRNVVDRLGMEIMYDMYCPLIQSVDIIKIEKRLDGELFYLRDALPEYSTFPLDMEPEYLTLNQEVPINPIKVKLKPEPWHVRWERMDMKGIELEELPVHRYKLAEMRAKPWEKYDLMSEYRNTVPEEVQAKIYDELTPHLPKFEEARRKMKKVKI